LSAVLAVTPGLPALPYPPKQAYSVHYFGAECCHYLYGCGSLHNRVCRM